MVREKTKETRKEFIREAPALITKERMLWAIELARIPKYIVAGFSRGFELGKERVLWTGERIKSTLPYLLPGRGGSDDSDNGKDKD